MVQALPKLTTFPPGDHEQVVGFLNRKINIWLDQSNLDYFVPNTAVMQLPVFVTGYRHRPDIMLIDPDELSKEPLWKKESVITLGKSVKLAIEVVSRNWPDDYARKFEDYEAMGVEEYWIVDYLGLGGRRYIGSPKQPTTTVCKLVNGTYETTLFRREDTVTAATYSKLAINFSSIMK